MSSRDDREPDEVEEGGGSIRSSVGVRCGCWLWILLVEIDRELLDLEELEHCVWLYHHLAMRRGFCCRGVCIGWVLSLSVTGRKRYTDTDSAAPPVMLKTLEHWVEVKCMKTLTREKSRVEGGTCNGTKVDCEAGVEVYSRRHRNEM